MNVIGQGGVRAADSPYLSIAAPTLSAKHVAIKHEDTQLSAIFSPRAPAELPLVYAKPDVTSVAALSRPERALPAQSLSTLRAQARNLLVNDFPDIRAVAKQAMEERLLRALGLSLDADRTYFNVFRKFARLPGEDGVEFRGHPQISRSLTDVLLYGFDNLEGHEQLTDIVDDAQLSQRTGVFRDGPWGRRFGRENKVDALTPALLEKIVSKNAINAAYPAMLSDFWKRNSIAMQTLAEVDILHFAMTHRRADEPLRAIGLDAEEVARLGLSVQATNMLAEALDRRDPDAPNYGTRVYQFDINGYASEDMAWLQSHDGRVLLLMPDNTNPIREYGSVELMRADIRKMVQSVGGRAELGAHFSRYNRSDGAFYQGVDKWLVDIAAGNYDSRVCTLRTAYASSLSEHFANPDRRGMTLLSDKALGMLSEAAGFNWHAYGPQGTHGFVFDIDTYPSSDMSWLRAEDGHVLLLMPGSEQPVREFKDIDSMRLAIREMTLTKDGISELVSHFSVYNRRDGTTYQGVDQWLTDIRSGAYDRYIAMAPKQIQGSVFRDQLKRVRDAEFERMRYLTQSKATSPVQKRDWISSYGPDNALLSVAILPEQEALQLQSDELRSVAGEGRSRGTRDLGEDFAAACERARSGMRQWHDSVTMRLGLIIERLRSAVASRLDPASRQEVSRPNPAGSRESGARAPNAYGFIERNDFTMLYRYEFIPFRQTPVWETDPRHMPERDGFRPQQAFASGRRMLDGDVADFYLTPEAARRAALLNRREGGHFWLYEVDASGLQGVSVGDNRANNPNMDVLMQNRGRYTQVRVGGLLMAYSMSDYVWLEKDMVQLRLEREMESRMVRDSVMSLDELRIA